MSAIVGLGLVAAVPAWAQSPPPSPQTSIPAAMALTLDDLVRMSPAELDGLFACARPGVIPCGRVEGRALVFPGSPLAVPASRAARFYWQGKIFEPEHGTAINRFFGVRIIRGVVDQGTSWRDGCPCLVLDYTRTSLLYRRVRDEIREVAPGLYLGVMYRTEPHPRFLRYFAFQAHP
jgi:hypothetical protein